MPYFERRPIEGLVDSAVSAIAGLPSRVRALPRVATASSRPVAQPTANTGIVEQANAVLASERSSVTAQPYAHPASGNATPPRNARIAQLQEQLNGLVEQFVGLATRPPGLDRAAPQAALYGQQQPAADAASAVLEPAPVLSPAEPVAPGGTAEIVIPLVNEDEQAVQIAFLSTSLVGEGGEQIACDRVTFQPHELTLQPGKTGEVLVRVVVPEQTRCGIYSGLIRASRIDYLHAVLVVQVEQGSSY